MTESQNLSRTKGKANETVKKKIIELENKLEASLLWAKVKKVQFVYLWYW